MKWTYKQEAFNSAISFKDDLFKHFSELLAVLFNMEYE